MTLPTLTLPRFQLLAALARPAAMARDKERQRIELNPRNCVWLRAQDEVLRITGANASVDVLGWCKDIVTGGDIACGVAGRKFLDLVSRLPEGPVSLSYDADAEKLLVKAGRSRAALATMDVKYAPQIEQPAHDMRPMDGKRFAAAVAAVAPSAGDEEPMDQIRFTPCRDGLLVEAVCGPEFVRLTLELPASRYLSPGAWTNFFDASCGTDARRLYGLHKWIETATSMYVSEKRLFFADADTCWSVPVRRGQFAPTDRLLEHLRTHEAALDLDTETFLGAADRLALYLVEGDKKMCLEIGPAGAWLSLDGGRGIEPLSDATRADPLRVLLPGQDFGRLLRRAPSSRVRLLITGQRSPLGVHALDDSGHVKPGYVALATPFTSEVEAYISVEEAA